MFIQVLCCFSQRQWSRPSVCRLCVSQNKSHNVFRECIHIFSHCIESIFLREKISKINSSYLGPTRISMQQICFGFFFWFSFGRPCSFHAAFFGAGEDDLQVYFYPLRGTETSADLTKPPSTLCTTHLTLVCAVCDSSTEITLIQWSIHLLRTVANCSW